MPAGWVRCLGRMSGRLYRSGGAAAERLSVGRRTTSMHHIRDDRISTSAARGRLFLGLLAALLPAALLGGAAPVSATDESSADPGGMGSLPREAGIHSLVYETPDGFSLRYAFDVPRGVEAGEKRPLVLALHYGFDRSQAFPAYYGRGFLEGVVAPGLHDLGAYIVAPDSHGNHWADPEIAERVLALLDRLAAHASIDGDKVVVTGYSMGGAGTWWFLANHGDRFAAAVPMAGRFRSDTASKIADVPIHVVHSRADELIPLDKVRILIEVLRKRGLDVRLTEPRDIKHYQSPRYAPVLQQEVVPWLRDVLALRDGL